MSGPLDRFARPCCYMNFDRYDYYSSVIPALGELVAGDRDSYQFLVESIGRFPSQNEGEERREGELELHRSSWGMRQRAFGATENIDLNEEVQFIKQVKQASKGITTNGINEQLGVNQSQITGIFFLALSEKTVIWNAHFIEFWEFPGKLSRREEMIKRRLNFNRRTNESSESTTSSTEEETEWEMRPGGMLVQKRTEISDSLTPNLRLRIAFGSVMYEISARELKKLLMVETGLQPAEQRLIFRGKERENGAYLDLSGVKDRSKVILIDDPASRERRLIEMRRIARIQTAQCKINDVSMEVDRLAEQVSAIESSVANSKMVPEVQITTLIEMLMRQAVKLDSISAEGDDACAQKNLQGKRVQKCVETLDVLKVSNARVKPVIVTTNWETFDHPPPPAAPPPITAHWEFFD
ncbi:hypothetical protein U1Q18_009701 [Sarracenia purpurea var. burkii]